MICEDVAEQRVAECCGEFLDITLPHLSPHLSLPPRIFICDYFDTKNALPFFLTHMPSPDCVSGLWSSSIQPPPGPTVFPDEDTVAVNQPSDLGPNVSVQSSPSSVPSYFRYGSPATRRITVYEHFSGSLPFLWLVRLLLLVSACLLSTFRSLVPAFKFCFSIQVWLLRLHSFPRALFGALHASLRRGEVVFAFPSFIEEDFLGAVTASKSRQIVLDSGCSASTTNDESHFVGPFSNIARPLRFLVGSVVASAEGQVQVITRGGPLHWPAICVKDSPFELLSTSYLASQGFDCLFTDVGATVFERDSGRVVATATLRNGLHFLDLSDGEVHLTAAPSSAPRTKKSAPPRHATLRTPSPTTLQVWHNRLCHIPLRLIKSMARHETVAGLLIATNSTASLVSKAR